MLFDYFRIRDNQYGLIPGISSGPKDGESLDNGQGSSGEEVRRVREKERRRWIHRERGEEEGGVEKTIGE